MYTYNTHIKKKSLSNIFFISPQLRGREPFSISTALIPITAFVLGTWQVQRLDWKTRLIAKFEDRLIRDPLPLPPHIDPSVVSEFDYRRVLATGRFRHDQEMLVGPRMRDGQDGFMVITPLERKDGSTILVNRGWISKKHRSQRTRPDSLVQGTVTVQGLLREPWKKNMFTPDNRPDKGEFYFPDVLQMAALTGSQPVWIEVTMGKCLLLPTKLSLQSDPTKVMPIPSKHLHPKSNSRYPPKWLQNIPNFPKLTNNFPKLTKFTLSSVIPISISISISIPISLTVHR